MTALPTAVLFACTMNTIRSPIAAGLCRALHGQRMFVDSVGVHAGQPDGFSIQVMAEIGVDISGHRPRTFEELDDSFFDVVVSLSPHAQHKAVEMVRTLACDVVFWNTYDPSVTEGSREAILHSYREVRDDLDRRIRDLFPPG